MNSSLRKQIEKAVRKFTIEDDGNTFDSLLDFKVEKISRGVYYVSGTVTGSILSSPIDSGDYYEPPRYDEYEVDAEVALMVYTHRNGCEAEVELAEIYYDKEPWEDCID